MELRTLQYFLMVAREENITKAAKYLHLTQPTLSRQIMQLEEELGVKLFTRSNHNIILTEDGMLLKRRAQEIVSLAEKTKRDFLHKKEQLTGEVAIGSGEFRSTEFLSQLIASFHEQYPLVRYELYSGNADNIKERIEQGSLDLGLMLEPVDIRAYEFIPMPMKEKWGILVWDESELANKKYVKPEELANAPLIVAKNNFVQTDLEKWFGKYYNQLEIIATGNLLYNEAIMTKNKIGIVICLKLDSVYENLRFIPLYPELESSSVLAWKKNQLFSPAVSAFIEHAKKCDKGISSNKV